MTFKKTGKSELLDKPIEVKKISNKDKKKKNSPNKK